MKLPGKKKNWIVMLASVVVIITLAFAGPQEKYFEIARNLDIFASLFKEVNGYYVDEVDPEELVAIGINAMTESLDPYTIYIPEEETAAFRTITTGKYAGIGILVAKINGYTTVTMVDNKYPAYKAGLKIGDKILKVDNNALANTPPEEISRLLKGEIDKEVVLTIERFGESSLIELSIKRENIKISNVPYFGMLDETIGYIKLSDFTTDAAKEVSTALNSLKEDGATAIVLDLRGNPGGLLNEAIGVCNVFVGKGKEVVSTKGQVGDWNRSHKTPGEPVDADIPLAVLIDNRSASAAEIVAGVIQDYDRGILVGQKSFGKGLVQTTRGLPYNAQLKVTTAKYYTPSGRCIQAIDYASKGDNGEAAKIPDSLKVAFKTTNGRTVFDGGGIDPDLKVENEISASVVTTLLGNGMIFNYATEYYYTHKDIPSPESFVLSESMYKEFTKWLSQKGFDYDTRVELELKHIRETASKEKYYDNIKDKIAQLEETLRNQKEGDLKAFQPEISRYLASEIVSRYQLEEGKIRFLVKDDQTVAKAKEFLKDKERYESALQARR